MKRQADPALIGGFVVAGLLALAAALMVLGGDSLFSHKDRAVMHFTGSVYGLQEGAPVVFRGVRVGSVASIRVVHDRAGDSYPIRVLAEFDAGALDDLGEPAGRSTTALPTLLKRGLTAQLSMQSLLTGLLYVDLDLRPQRNAVAHGSTASAVEIPTSPTVIQTLKSQLDSIDLRRITEDLASIASSARALVAGPELKRALTDLTEITAATRRLAQRLDRRVDPLADDVQHSLAEVRLMVQQLGRAARGVDDGAQRVGGAADRATALLAADSPLVQQLQRSADEVARSAASVGQATAGDSPLMRGSERALHDLSAAARALRDLAEALEQQPEALLRGREQRR